jgi:hypothetical protein
METVLWELFHENNFRNTILQCKLFPVGDSSPYFPTGFVHCTSARLKAQALFEILRVRFLSYGDYSKTGASVP